MPQEPRDEQAVYEELHTSLPRRYMVSPTNTSKHSGTIRWYNVAKGVGFIAPHVPGPNLFVHRTSLAAGYTEPESGESVSYHAVPVAPNERAMMAHEKMTMAVEHGERSVSDLRVRSPRPPPNAVGSLLSNGWTAARA